MSRRKTFEEFLAAQRERCRRKAEGAVRRVRAARRRAAAEAASWSDPEPYAVRLQGATPDLTELDGDERRGW